MRSLTLLIIAGGKSSRLGVDKRFVEVGGVTLLENILAKAAAQNFAEIFLCVEEILTPIKILAEKYGVKISVDKIQGAGPMAALATALEKISTDWALAVSVDMPFFQFESLTPLINFDVQVTVPIANGRAQPLAALYSKSMAEFFLRELSAGQRKLIDAIKKVPSKFVELSTDETIFFNVNTRANLQLARGRAANLSRRTPIISIVAPTSGTGKTTFIEKILRELTDLKIGVVKSTHHKISAENFTKDSYRFRLAGEKKFMWAKNFLTR